MKNKNIPPPDPDRRKFITTVTAGVAGGVLLPGSIHAAQAEETEKADLVTNEGDIVIKFVINGHPVQLCVQPQTTLLEVIRNSLGLSGTKLVCNNGECGACTVLLDDTPVYSCHTLAIRADGHTVTTIEGLMDGEQLHPIQEAFIEMDGMQCGFCTPGQIMTAAGLLFKHSNPSSEQIRSGMSGTICRCAAYTNIEKSVKKAAEKIQHGGMK